MGDDKPDDENDKHGGKEDDNLNGDMDVTDIPVPQIQQSASSGALPSSGGNTSNNSARKLSGVVFSPMVQKSIQSAHRVLNGEQEELEEIRTATNLMEVDVPQMSVQPSQGMESFNSTPMGDSEKVFSQGVMTQIGRASCRERVFAVV